MEQQMVFSIISGRVVLGDVGAPLAAYIFIPLAFLAVVGIMVGIVVVFSSLVIKGIKKAHSRKHKEGQDD